MDRAPGKLSSKELPSITVRRESLEKYRKGSSSENSRTSEAKREGRSSVGFGEQTVGKPATPATRRALAYSNVPNWAGPEIGCCVTLIVTSLCPQAGGVGASG